MLLDVAGQHSGCEPSEYEMAHSTRKAVSSAAASRSKLTTASIRPRQPGRAAAADQVQRLRLGPVGLDRADQPGQLAPGTGTGRRG